MIKYGSKHLDNLITNLVIGDLLIIVLSWYLSYLARFVVPYQFFDIDQPVIFSWQYILSGPIVVVLFVIIATEMNLYRPHIIYSITEQFYKICLILVLTTAIWFTILFFSRFFPFSRLYALIFIILSLLGLVALRVRYISWYKLNNKQAISKSTKVIIIGSGPALEKLVNKIHLDESGLLFAGYVADQPFPNIDNYLGSISNIDSIITTTSCDEIFVILDKDNFKSFDVLNNLIKFQHLDINLLFSDPELYFINPEVIRWDELTIVAARQYPILGIDALKKRIFDFAASLLLVIMCIPLWIIIGLLIKLTSKGPILYLQKRTSLNGQTFNIIKFRTMVVDAEKAGPRWATADDNRKTYIGNFLRQSSLDETPQFINVLLGQMSLVGPRPERPEFVEKFRKNIPSYMSRHKIRAGITGWAQVNGWRGDTSLVRRIEHDLYYINNWSLLFDIKIIFMTIIRGFKNKNAY